MEPEEATEYVTTDPELSAAEKEMSIGFSKKTERATIFTAIASQVRRCLTHTDVEVTELYLYDKDTENRSVSTVEEFGGDKTIVGLKGKFPIESLKIQSNPRSQRGYAQIISPQTSVNIDG